MSRRRCSRDSTRLHHKVTWSIAFWRAASRGPTCGCASMTTGDGVDSDQLHLTPDSISSLILISARSCRTTLCRFGAMSVLRLLLTGLRGVPRPVPSQQYVGRAPNQKAWTWTFSVVHQARAKHCLLLPCCAHTFRMFSPHFSSAQHKEVWKATHGLRRVANGLRGD